MQGGLPQYLNYGRPLNWAHPLNRKLVFRHKVLPMQMHGKRLLDMVGRNHATYTNGAGGAVWAGPALMVNACGSFNLDGTNDYLALDRTPTVSTTNFTLSWHGNVVNDASYSSLLNNPNNHGLAHDFGTGFFIGTDDFTNQSISISDANMAGAHVWSLTLIATGASLYRDGTLAGSSTWASTTCTLGSQLFSSDLGSYHGAVSEIMLHDRVLDASEVNLLHQAMRSKQDPTLNWYSHPIMMASVAVGGGPGRVIQGGLIRGGLLTGGRLIG